jgi:phospholipid/cholesterol/gamma-HCH transport system substrate-binding protein
MASRRKMRWRRAVTGASALAAAATLSVGLGACGSSGPGTITASATFTDVADLVAGAPVQYADISVGSVKSISLSGDEAKVVMTIDRSAKVPADVTAQLTQSSILGQHLVSLVAPSAGGPLLHNGAVISKTEFVPGIQQLVESGAAVFGAVNGAQLSQIINNGAEGFGGQAANIRQLLDDFDTILAGYSSRSGEITSLIDNLDAFNSTLAPNAQQDAQAVSNLAQTTQILAQQSSRFEQLLQSLDDLATQGQSILSTGLTQTEDQINALAAVADQLYRHQRDLATILEELPLHNQALAGLVVNNYAQILEDVIVCGIPGGGAGQTADSTCNPSGGGG